MKQGMLLKLIQESYLILEVIEKLEVFSHGVSNQRNMFAEMCIFKMTEKEWPQTSLQTLPDANFVSKLDK